MAAIAAGLAGLLVLDPFGAGAPPVPEASAAAAPAATASVSRAAPAPERAPAARAAPQAPAVAHASAAAPAPRPNERANPVAAQPTTDNRIAVSPPAAPADPRPPAPRGPLLNLSPEDIAAHLSRGEERLKRGELAAARLYFERVALAGDRRGAHGMARTYDPAVLAGLPILGPQADAAVARQWYQRAETQRAAR
jgi:hypothetical protein